MQRLTRSFQKCCASVVCYKYHQDRPLVSKASRLLSFWIPTPVLSKFLSEELAALPLLSESYFSTAPAGNNPTLFCRSFFQLTLLSHRSQFQTSNMVNGVVLSVHVNQPTCLFLVIDFCLTKELMCDPETNYQALRIAWASLASLTQRKGRE